MEATLPDCPDPIDPRTLSDADLRALWIATLARIDAMHIAACAELGRRQGAARRGCAA